MSKYGKIKKNTKLAFDYFISFGNYLLHWKKPI